MTRARDTPRCYHCDPRVPSRDADRSTSQSRVRSSPLRMTDTAKTTAPAERPAALPDYQPHERFWPYVELTEEPTPEELAALDPDLRTALYGPAEIPFSFTLVFPRFDGPEYE